MINAKLWKLDAVATAAAIRAGEISSREATQAALNRLDQVNPIINAVANSLHDAALAQADNADRAQARGHVTGPLHGVPLTVKINVDLSGQATTNGLVPLRNAIAPEDSAPVANMKNAGAVIIGQTNVPAFCYRWFSSNDLHGTTCNPWDLSKSPGGSSGGAAAAAATGIGTLAHGNDVAGSLRLPAALCGVFGMKATMGRIPSVNPSAPGEPPLTLQSGASEGVIARTVRDIRLGLEVLAQPDSRDPGFVPSTRQNPDLDRPCKVALYLGEDDIAVDPAISERLRQTAAWLEDAGYVVEETGPPDMARISELWMAMLYAECQGPVQEMFFEMADERFRASFLNTQANLPALGAEGYMAAWQARRGYQRAWAAFLDRYPLVLTPTMYSPAFPIDHDVRDKETMKEIMAAYSTLPAVAALALPAISVPIGFAQGTPVGGQLIARWFEDNRCLAAAEVIEQRNGLMIPIDPVMN